MKLNLFILGMQRSGTTSLFEVLKKNKNISYTKIKEINIFSDKFFENSNHNIHSSFEINLQNIEDYIYVKDKSKYLLEASVNYFYSINAPKLIHKYNKNAKFIIIRRNPIDRMYSHYLMDINNSYHNMNFESSIRDELYNQKIIGSDLGYIEMSRFEKYFYNWLNYFDKSKFLLINFEDVFLNKKVTEIDKFLKINLENNIPKSNYSSLFKNKIFLDFYLFSKKYLNKKFIPIKLIKTIMPLFQKDPVIKIDKKLINELENFFSEDLKYFNNIKNN